MYISKSDFSCHLPINNVFLSKHLQIYEEARECMGYDLEEECNWNYPALQEWLLNNLYHALVLSGRDTRSQKAARFSGQKGYFCAEVSSLFDLLEKGVS